jgi:hypothetical protein
MKEAEEESRVEGVGAPWLSYCWSIMMDLL